MLIFMPPSAVHGQPYLEELEPYFVAFHLTSVSNTSKFYLKYAATLHTQALFPSIVKILNAYHDIEIH